MSALTKLFVVALVVCSLLLSASVVVFVNRVEDFRAVAETRQREMDAARRTADAAVSDANAKSESARAREAEANARTETLRGELTTLQGQLGDKTVLMAEASKQQALMQLENGKLSEAIKASQDAQGKLQDQIVALRGSSDDLQKKNSDLNITLNDITNKLEVTERERRFDSEQLTEAQSTVARYAAQLKDAGVKPASENEAVGQTAGAPRIDAVVKSVRQIDGIPYATISVGSSDNVTKGMQFSVIDPKAGAFLGFLTVDTVDTKEAAGRLEGPKVNEIGPDSKVMTGLTNR